MYVGGYFSARFREFSLFVEKGERNWEEIAKTPWQMPGGKTRRPSAIHPADIQRVLPQFLKDNYMRKNMIKRKIYWLNEFKKK